MKGTVLIAGASGLVGAAAVESFLADGYDVIALSRRRPEVDSTQSFTHSAVDLRDAVACRDAAKRFGAVTHVVYTAVFELPASFRAGARRSRWRRISPCCET
jgi:nucleoside-diphosphate-sugar epimerase